jgi:hypothetical protein
MRYVLVLLAACASPVASVESTAPLVAGGSDEADHACTVVLRQFVDGAGVIETTGATPQVLYESREQWLAIDATPSGAAATPGYTRFAFTLDDAAQLIPYVALPSGGRLFDHNRTTDNYVATVWPDPTVCAPIGGPTHANLVFDADFTQHRTGLLEPGGDVSIVYDASRLAPCREVQGGFDQWAVTAHVQFAPGTQEQDAIVTDAPATLAVPSDAQSVAVWFEATNVDGCHQWDSNDGANYSFHMMRAPQWVGLATNLFTRDDSGDPCDGGSPAEDGMSYDTWVRSQATVTNLCFQVYQPGITDTQDPNLWQDLDVELQLQGTSIPVDFDRFVGNNARYKISWRDLDPLRAFNCPTTPVTPTSDGMYVQTQLGYYVTVNGYQLRPEPGASYQATFVDYPNNAWRAANCGT